MKIIGRVPHNYKNQDDIQETLEELSGTLYVEGKIALRIIRAVEFNGYFYLEMEDIENGGSDSS